MNYVACAILGVIAVFAFSRGWNKAAIGSLLLAGVMLATTAIGPHLQNGVTTGIDAGISTLYAFFH
jgi:hypothetical protein